MVSGPGVEASVAASHTSPLRSKAPLLELLPATKVLSKVYSLAESSLLNWKTANALYVFWTEEI